MDFDWNVLWWWAADGEVWSGIRGGAAALAGAAVGGGFTAWGQRRAADAARTNALRDQSREDATRLFSAFTELRRDIRNAPKTFMDYVHGGRWISTWKTIWTDDKSLDFDVRSRLLTDGDARAQVQTVVHYLDRAALYAEQGNGRYRTQEDFPLHTYADQLADEGAEVIAAYLRGEAHQSSRAKFFAHLREFEHEYDQWEEAQIEAAERQADDWARGQADA